MTEVWCSACEGYGCPVCVPAVERPSEEDFERLEAWLATVDPDPKRGEQSWLFADEIASITRVLAAAREAERQTARADEWADAYMKGMDQRNRIEERYRERVAALEALLDEIEDLVAPAAQYRTEMGVDEAVEVPDNVCAEAFEAIHRYRRALAAEKETE